jgi:hypothetical protein
MKPGSLNITAGQSGSIAAMRLVLALLAAASIAGAKDMLSVFDQQWEVVNAADWKVETDGGAPVLELLKARGPLPGPRRPIQFAIAQTGDFEKATIELEMRPRQRSMIIVVRYRDPAHFDYAHLSVDTGARQPVHNGIFHVFGGERVRISSQAGPAAFAATNRWYHVVLKSNGESGEISVSVDGQDVPALHAFDLSLSSGKVGLGSFDETGDFKNVKISGSR